MRLANTTMQYQVCAIRAKPVASTQSLLRVASDVPCPLFSSLQILSSQVPGIVQSVSGTPALRPRRCPLTLSPNASTSWTPLATALSSPSQAACSIFLTFARWTRLSRRARAPSNSSLGPSPACPTAKVRPYTYRLYSLDNLWLSQGTRPPP